MSYDGDTLRYYINGKEAGAKKIGKVRSPGQFALAFGRREDGFGDGMRFKGAVDEIRISSPSASGNSTPMDLSPPKASPRYGRTRPWKSGWPLQRVTCRCKNVGNSQAWISSFYRRSARLWKTPDSRRGNP